MPPKRSNPFVDDAMVATTPGTTIGNHLKRLNRQLLIAHLASLHITRSNQLNHPTDRLIGHHLIRLFVWINYASAIHSLDQFQELYSA